MNNIIHLRSEDFYIGNGSKGKILCTNIKGLSLVMFTSNNCNYCKDLIPHFKKLPQVINGCNFCVLNISDNKDVAIMSKDTIATISYVPYIVFYVHGKPYLQYDDMPMLEKLIEFVNYAIKLVSSKKSFIDKEVKNEFEIPDFTIGIPYNLVCEQDFCYLNYNQAYTANAPTPGQKNVQMAQQQFEHFRR